MDASGTHANAIAARWLDTDIGSPRRRMALPPRAATTSTSGRFKRGHKDCLDGVHPVLRLVEDDGVLRLEHIVGHLEARTTRALEDVVAHLGPAVVERRKAVHELDVGVPQPQDR